MAFDNDNLAVDRVELLGVCLDHLRECVRDLFSASLISSDWGSTRARSCR